MTFTIEQLEALKEGTTPAPWKPQHDTYATLWVDCSNICDDTDGKDADLAFLAPALLDQLIAREAELQQLKTRIKDLADWHDIKAMKAKNFPWPGEQHEARFQGKAETHETARNKLTQILEETNV
ncbi:hypothetical protein SEA_PSONYX_55 [Corynebacterium phage PSonyx]|nr:hypothetical protein SEA_PSONYX_55 [Corynebacterium phage PSonyx]